MLLSRSRLAYTNAKPSDDMQCYPKHKLASKNICKPIVNNQLGEDPFVSGFLNRVFCCNYDLENVSRLGNSMCAPAASPPEG